LRFGGHDTFHIRDGWLHKGLMLLKEHPERLVAEYASDHLGVGRNMAKAINHWLIAAGLAVKEKKAEKSREIILRPTAFGNLVYKEDQHFIEPGTWWALHVNLVNSDEYAGSWVWFFNKFNQFRFEKSGCLERLHRYLEQEGKRVPSNRTLERDLSCLLNTYSRRIPVEDLDPEESLVCPLTELGLLNHYRSSNSYRIEQGKKMVPPHLIGYSVFKALETQGTESVVEVGDFERVTIQEAVTGSGQPGRAFALSSEALFETLVEAGQLFPAEIKIEYAAGDRALLVEKKTNLLDWMKAYYAAEKAAYEKEVAYGAA
jgi:hypothetical protein